jgi:hypothetical protein
LAAKTPAKKGKATAKAASVGDSPKTHRIAASTQKQLERLHRLNMLTKAVKPDAKSAAKKMDLSGEGKRGGPALKDF